MMINTSSALLAALPVRWLPLSIGAAAVALLTLAAPGASLGACDETPDPRATQAPVSPTPSLTPSPSPSPSPGPASPAAEPAVGTVVRFSNSAGCVDVTIGEDSPATRDFLSMLPLTLTLEEFAGREKIAYLPRELAYEGSPGSDPEDGDLIYYTPWGNLGFYYDTSGVGYSDQTLHIGTYRATRDQLAELEGQVHVEVVQ